MKRILIIHGWSNRRQPDHWQRNLAVTLRRAGHAVAYPQLPNTDTPVLDEWLEVVENELSMLDEISYDELVVFGHSLGCLTWLNAVKNASVKSNVSRVMLVAPADPALCDDAATFQLDLNDSSLKNAVHAVANSTLLVGSDGDPWIPNGVQATFATPLDLPFVIVPGASHFAGEEGWGHWQGVVDWVTDPAADLSSR
jgi:predicted alpha/beta hydrolase family esterase